jgi:hypothetical protein
MGQDRPQQRTRLHRLAGCIEVQIDGLVSVARYRGRKRDEDPITVAQRHDSKPVALDANQRGAWGEPERQLARLLDVD